jgi:hypothetical protein
MKAIDYIRKGWTQGKSAVDRNDNGVEADNPLACKWCAMGAISKAYSITRKYFIATDKLQVVVGESIVRWNDTTGRTQAEVIAAFKKAGI